MVTFDFEFIGRLAALVPHTREHQLTYHGVLAPASTWRDTVVPRSTRGASLNAVTSDSGASDAPPQCPEASSPPASRPSSRYDWAELMRRVFSIDVLRCERCGGRRKHIAFITDLLVARRILVHLGLDPEPPRVAPARSP